MRCGKGGWYREASATCNTVQATSTPATALTRGAFMSKACLSTPDAVNLQVPHASSGVWQGIPCIHGPGSVSVALLMAVPGAKRAPEGTCRTCAEIDVGCGAYFAAGMCSHAQDNPLQPLQQSLLHAVSLPGRLPSSCLWTVIQKLPDRIVCVLHSQHDTMYIRYFRHLQRLCLCCSTAGCQRTSPELLWMVKRSFCGPPAAFIKDFNS